MRDPRLYEFIAGRKLAVLSTKSPSGDPQSALIGIAVTTELEIVFDTVSSSRKYANLLASPACSLVIGWEGEQTVQYEGRAEQLRPPERDRYLSCYYSAWPDGPSRRSWPGLVYFVVRPTWIRYSDFGCAPPVIMESTAEVG